MAHKSDRTAVFRVEAYRKRKTAAGWKQQGFLLPPDVIAGLEALAEARRVSKSELVCRLVRAELDAEAVL